MTKVERNAITAAAERINDLASLKISSFGIGTEEEREIGKRIRPYMMWFESVAGSLIDMVNADETGDVFAKRVAMEELFRK